MSDASLIARRLADGLDYMGQVVGGLSGEDVGLGLPKVTGAQAEASLAAMRDLYTQLSEKVRTAITSAERVRVARESGAALAASSEDIENRLGVTSTAAGVLGGRALPLTLLAVALVSLVLLSALFAMGGNIRKTIEVQASRNERNQEAILRLLDELSSLADGDLTVQATVTEDITGAIADSINYAIEALRELVATINDTAITLDAAAKQTQSSAGHLAKASVAQSKQIGLASESVQAMAGSTEEVSGNAERSADVARHSVDVAHKGGDAVRRTIDGMNAIRETIQETSKRIKRLGESSQEIGNIVELINDIAEQTNILALNASIQASMDSGRHQRSGGLDGAQHHGRGRRRAARGKRRRGAGRDRAGVEPDREPGAEHFGQCAPAGFGRRQHLAEHARAARNQYPDRGEFRGHLELGGQARRTVRAIAQVGGRLQAAGPRCRRLGSIGDRSRAQGGDGESEGRHRVRGDAAQESVERVMIAQAMNRKTSAR